MTPTIRSRRTVARRFMFFGFGAAISGWLYVLFFLNLPLPTGHHFVLWPLIAWASLGTACLLGGSAYLVTHR